MGTGSVQDDVAPHAMTAEEEPAPVVRAASHPWNDVPLRNKVILLLVLAAVGGALIGMLEASLSNRGIVLSLGLSAMVGGLLLLARHWIGGPFERLVSQLGRISREYNLPAINALPIHRRDEVGQIARAIHEITSTSRRDYYEAKHLRRTLDHRVALATRSATRELRRMAMRDSLTDLGNRRFLDNHFETLVESVKQSGSELVCIVIDIDNFKTVNDTLGHAKGDDLLRFLASLIRGSSRGEDYAVRLGGDEFAVLMPACTVERAAEYAKRLLMLFVQHVSVNMPAEPRASLSIGIASLTRDHAKTGKHLMEQADAHLYTAKRAGKNQIAGG